MDIAQVWTSAFGAKLAIRPETQHKQCGICVRHKTILKKLGADRLAREGQMNQYQLHLKRQFNDRSVYWSNRAQSRLRQLLPCGTLTLSCIIDGIDHSKLKFPRSMIILSKEMSGFLRPSMDMVGCICHGYGIWMINTLPHVAKDSCLTIDILTHMLHCLSVDGLDCRSADLRLQSDNTTRETKNNVTLRWLSCLVGSHRLRRGELNCLSTGHSHEDIDQVFSIVTNTIQREKELHQPSDFCAALERLLADQSFRPHERIRQVELVTSVREWTHGFCSKLLLFNKSVFLIM